MLGRSVDLGTLRRAVRIRVKGKATRDLRLSVQAIELRQSAVQHARATVTHLNVRFDVGLVERNVDRIQLQKQGWLSDYLRLLRPYIGTCCLTTA